MSWKTTSHHILYGVDCFVCVYYGWYPCRSALLTHVLATFQRKSLQELLYLADNLAYFPYQVADEVLFIIHQVSPVLKRG